MSNRRLESTWQDFRFKLRDTVKEFTPSQAARANALPTAASDPEQIAPFLRGILATLEQLGHEGEESPVLRTAKMLFKPSPAHRARKDLLKSFEKYQAVWNETNAPAAKG